MQLGPYTLPNPVFVAPMAGVTDRPFRRLCRDLGAGYAVSEMAASDPRLRDSVKTQRRTNHAGEAAPRAVQIAGAHPDFMAQAARFNVERGAQIIDINMGCPARKVCQVMAGSALMADEPLALAIVAAVVAAVPVPVKMMPPEVFTTVLWQGLQAVVGAVFETVVWTGSLGAAPWQEPQVALVAVFQVQTVMAPFCWAVSDAPWQ